MSRLLKKLITILGIGSLLTPLLIWEAIPSGAFVLSGIAFEVLTLLMVAAYIPLAAITPKTRLQWNDPFVKALTAFAGIYVLASALSIDPFESFLSSPLRMFGGWMVLLIVAWILVMRATRETREEWYPLLLTSVAVSGVMAILALAQGIVSSTDGFRAIGTMGNPVFLGAYLVLNTLLAIWLLRQLPRKRTFLGVITILNIIAIPMTGSRAAALALVLGIFVVLLIGGKKRTRSFAVAVGVIILLLAAFTSVQAPSTPTSAIERATSFTLDTTRLRLWSHAVQGIAKAPLLGHGPEQFDVTINAQMDPSGIDAVLIEPWPDRAHNAFLDVAHDTGLLGLASLLVILALAIRGVRAESKRAEMSGWYVAFFVIAMTVFFTPELLLLFLLVSAVITHRVEETRDPKAAPIIPAMIVGLLPLLVIPALHIKPLVALIRYQEAINDRFLEPMSTQQKLEQAFIPSRAQPSLVLASVNPFAAWAPLDRVSYAARPLSVIQPATMSNAQQRAYDYQSQIAAMQATLLAMDADVISFEEGFAAIQEAGDHAHRLGPHRPEVREQFGELAIAINDPEEAVAFFQLAIEAAPNHPPTLGRLHFGLARAYAIANDRHQAIQQLDEAGANGYPIFMDVRLALLLLETNPTQQRKPNSRVQTYTSKVFEQFPNNETLQSRFGSE